MRMQRTALAVIVLVAVALACAIGFLVGRSGRSMPSSSSSEGSGHLVARPRHVPVFHQLDLTGSNEVVVTVGAPRSVTVYGDDNLVDRVSTVVRAGRLLIGTHGSFSTRAPMHVEVQVPSLDAIVLSGSGVIRASGRTARLDVTLTGSGDLQLASLAVRDVHAVVEGSGRILVAPTGRLDASVPGSGAIMYTGNPTSVVAHVTGSGAVVHA